VPRGKRLNPHPIALDFPPREASIPPAQLDRLCNIISKDFPADDTMYELHVLRACMAVSDGYAKIVDILPAKPVVAAPRRKGMTTG